MSLISKELRKPREEIKKEFEEYKREKQLNIEILKYFLSHCNVIPEIIETYLTILKEEDQDLFLEQLFLYYPILPVEVCKKFNVKKTKPEKERFFELINNLLAIQPPEIKKKLINFLTQEMKCYDEIKHLIPQKELAEKKESRKEKEFGKDEEVTNEKQELDEFRYSRWLNIYNTSIDFKTEDNEEFLFYHLSNNLISEFTKGQNCFLKRIKLIEYIINLFSEVYSRRKEGKIFSIYFEFLCIALTNCEKNNNFSEKIEHIIESIESEITDKFMSFDEIKKYLIQNNYKYELEDKKIIITYKRDKFIIDNYTLYNLNENIMNLILSKRRLTYKNFLEHNIKFSEHLNKMKNKTDLLIKIIKKFSCSNLAISSIEKLFNIEKKDYEELFKELGDNIENYIYLIPYNCFYDTERTFKNPMTIIIDPFKEKYSFEIKSLNNNLELESALKEFCNITFRKFCFEHEIHHLTTALLYFLYVNEENSLNSLTKEIMPDGEVKIYPELGTDDLDKNKNIQKEAGNLFELLCYGSIQKRFTLKQLLFLADENNDNLDYISFKEKYEDNCEKDLSEILNKFPENQLLSGHVKKIKECLENDSESISLEKVLNVKFIANKDDTGEKGNFYSILNDNNIAIVTESEKYDNHLLCERKVKKVGFKK